MKNLILFVLSVFAFIFLMSGSLPSESENHKIGTIVYSVLPPDLFREQNGNGWVLLDGGEDLTNLGLIIENTDLCQVMGSFCKEIPDARGYFLRTHDNRLDKKKRVDKERDLNTRIGSVQLDAFQGHGHNSTYGLIYLKKPETGDHGGATEGGNKDTWGNLGGIMNGYIRDDENGYGKPNHSFETRPKNLNFHTYIKVNKN